MASIRTIGVSAALSVLQVGLSIGLSALLARHLTSHDYGLFATLGSVAMIAAVLGHFGLPVIVMRETSRVSTAEERVALWRDADRAVLPTMMIAAICGVGAVAALAGPLTVAVAVPFVIQAPLMVLMALRAGALQGLGAANRAHAAMAILPPAITISILLAVAMAGAGVTIAGAISAATAGLVASACLLHWHRLSFAHVGRTLRPVGRERLRFLRRESLPMAGIAGLAIFNSQMDVLMLATLDGPATAGVYQAVLATAMILTVVRAKLGLLVSAELARQWAAGDAEAMRRTAAPITWAATMISLAALCGAMVYGPDLMSVLFGSDFTSGAMTLAVVCGAWCLAAACGMGGECLTMAG